MVAAIVGDARPTRMDGRACDALRPMTITTDFVSYPEGSALIEMGQTRVLCNASVTPNVPAMAGGYGPRLGDGRVCSASSLDTYPNPP